MSAKTAFLWALGVTVVSLVLLFITRGMPSWEQFRNAGIEIFIVAFFVMKFFGGSDKKKGEQR